MPGDSVVIRLPGPRVLRVLARSVLFAVALLSLPWLRTSEAPARSHTVDACGAAAAQAELLLRDLRRGGLLAPGARAVALGSDGDCDAPTPQKGQDSVLHLRPISLRGVLMIGDSSVDFLLDFGYFSEDGDRFAFSDRVLKHGGILAAPIDSVSVISLPHNYRVIYIRRFAEAFVGVKKIADDSSHAGNRVRLPSPASLKEGILSSQPAEGANGGFKNMGRKLLLSDITGTPAAHERRGW
ncbi:hypothetical protein BS78_K056100 [Paspalum vaginatum]|uniref:Uncharacterized protein n=1 Tax=Paspalum vaginatum TaxID=158149 RepID=A0A9W7XA96_9POAL|nr:hypothetical protein BS78_K056100 [Paspalum vaginatum]